MMTSLYRILLFILLLTSTAYGQATGTAAKRNDSAATTLQDVNKQPSWIAVDLKGRVFIINDSTTPFYDISDHAEDSASADGQYVSGAGLVRQATPTDTVTADGDWAWFKGDALEKLWTADNQTEDLAHVSGDRGSFPLGVRQDAWAAFSNNAGDYTPFSVTQSGAIRPDISVEWEESQSKSILKTEDLAAGSGDAIVGVGYKILATPVTQAGDGDYTLPLTDALSKIWTAGDQIEDSASGNGDRLNAIAGIRNALEATKTTTEGNYTTLSLTGKGFAMGVPMFDSVVAVANQLGKLNTTSYTSGDAGIASFARTSLAGFDAGYTANKYSVPLMSTDGTLYVDPVRRAAGTQTNPSVGNASSVTLLAANAARRWVLIQNNTAANICINVTGAAVAGIAPTTANPCFVLTAGSSYSSPPNFSPTSAITVWQASGGATALISVFEG